MPGEDDTVFTSGGGNGGGSPPPGSVQQMAADTGDAANAGQELQGSSTEQGGGIPMQPSTSPPTNEAGAGTEPSAEGSSTVMQGTSQGGALPEDSPVYHDGAQSQGETGAAKSGGLNAPPAKKVSAADYAKVVATYAQALRTTAHKMNLPLGDALLSMILAQINNESAFGVTGSMTGTNNIGATQATVPFAAKHKGQGGYGAFMHYDSDPSFGPFGGFYAIYPSPQAAADSWLSENWWGPALLRGQPATPTQYASILYAGGYFGGFHKPERSKLPRNPPFGPNEQANVDAYAKGIAASMGRMAASMNGAFTDPETPTVNAKSIPSLAKRGVTEKLFDAARQGRWAAWMKMVPSWSVFQRENGVIWFGPPPKGSSGFGLKGLLVALGLSAAAAAGIYYATKEG